MTELPVHTLHLEEIHSHSVTPEIQYSHKSTHLARWVQLVTTETPQPQRGIFKNMTQRHLTGSFVKSIKYYQKYRNFQLQWQQRTANTTQQHRVRTIIKRQVLLNILYLELHLAPILPFVTELLMNKSVFSYFMKWAEYVKMLIKWLSLFKDTTKGRQLQPQLSKCYFLLSEDENHQRPWHTMMDTDTSQLEIFHR